MGDGRWEMGDGRWEMGDGRWEVELLYWGQGYGILMFGIVDVEGEICDYIRLGGLNWIARSKLLYGFELLIWMSWLL
jgi:hypothetical protein